MARIPPHIIDIIMQTARIEEVIGEYVTLKRAGSNLKGLSPFTDEKTPSFVVSPGKQIFKCFSSGKGGTVVSFLMEKEHYSYPEALKWLADRYQIEIPKEAEPTADELAAISERESLYIINDFARDYFVNTLHETDEGRAEGLTYFIERGFSEETIKRFQLGYCLNISDGFTQAARDKGYKLEYLERVGLTKSKDDRYFDFFRGRVIFPIHSQSGRVLGFGARTLLGDKKIAKYFNSPESIIYNKSQILYGLYFAKGAIIKYDQCYLCEGYTDVISMHQSSIDNTVSSSGTALTKEQIRLIKRYTRNITILFDGDAAGIKASFRGIDLILEEDMNVKVVLFPDGEDPDSFSKRVSKEELKDYLSREAQDFISFKAEILLAESGGDALQQAGLIKDIVQSVALIPDQITRNVYVKQIAERFKFTENILHAELIKLRRTHQQRDERSELDDYLTVQTKQSNQEEVVSLKNEETWVNTEADLMRYLVKYGNVRLDIQDSGNTTENQLIKTTVAEWIIHELTEDELNFDNPLFTRIYRIITESLGSHILLKASAFRNNEDQEIVRFIADIETDTQSISHKWETQYKVYTRSEGDRLQESIQQALYLFKISKVVKRLNEIDEQLPHEEDEDALLVLLRQKTQLEQVKLRLCAQVGRIIIP